MKKPATSNRRKWIYAFIALLLVSMLILFIKVGYGIWYWFFMFLWFTALTVFTFNFMPYFKHLKLVFAGLFVLTMCVSFSWPLLSFSNSLFGNIGPGSGSAVYSCPDNDIHSKKVASGETVYWKCMTAHNSKNEPYSELILQVAEPVSAFPYNQKLSQASTVNDIRLYCLAYKVKGNSTPNTTCSSFSDYTRQMYGCSTPEECYNKNSTSSDPWIMPFVPSTIVGSVFPGLSSTISGIESIDQLLIYPTSGFNSQGSTDINEATVKYQPLKVIDLN